MKIKYISYVGEGNAQSQNKTHENVMNKLSPLDTDDKSSFVFCQTHGETLRELGESFSDSDAIVFLVGISEYNKTKSLLFKAMGIRCVKNPDVIAKIKDDETLSYLNEKQVAAHSAIPADATAFVTDDGLFSGFGIKSGEQKFIVLPIAEARVNEAMLEKVYEFIGKDADELPKEEELSVNESGEQDEVVPEAGEAEEATQEVTAPESEEAGEAEEEVTDPDDGESDAAPADILQENADGNAVQTGQGNVFETVQNQPLYGAGGVDDLVAQTLTNIGYSRIRIAFGVQRDNVVVDEYFRSKIVFRNTGLFTIVNVSKNIAEEDEEKCKTDLSQIARVSMRNAGASVGMAVSDVMVDENNKKFVISAMCDVKKTNIYKVYALPDESDEDIIISSIGNMFEILNARAMEFNEIQRKKNEENISRSSRRKRSKGKNKDKSNAPLIVLIVILVLLLAAVAIVAYSYLTGNAAVYELIEHVKETIFSRT